MFQPSPILCARLRLTTKQVNGGYYKGNRTGSMGAFTQYGKYIIDYRKVRHYNMPNIKDFYLTPFVTKEMEPTKREIRQADGTTYKPAKVDAMAFLKEWKIKEPAQYDYILKFQGEQQENKAQIQQQPSNSDASKSP